jgi:hypothetical protein
VFARIVEKSFFIAPSNGVGKSSEKQENYLLKKVFPQFDRKTLLSLTHSLIG